MSLIGPATSVAGPMKLELSKSYKVVSNKEHHREAEYSADNAIVVDAADGGDMGCGRGVADAVARLVDLFKVQVPNAVKSVHAKLLKTQKPQRTVRCGFCVLVNLKRLQKSLYYRSAFYIAITRFLTVFIF